MITNHKIVFLFSTIFYFFIIFNYEILKWLVFLWFMLRYGIKK